MSGPQIEQRVDRLLRAFLDERAETMALRAVSANEMAARLSPIVTRRWSAIRSPSLRWARLTRLPVVAAVVVGLVVIGGVLVFMTGDQRVASPSPSPSATTPAVVPKALRAPWIGGTGTLLTFTDSTLAIGPLEDPAQLLTTASGTADGSLRLTISGSCDSGAVGDYTWSLSPGGGRLTFTAVSDACAARLAALAGDWYRIRCKDPKNLCLGDLDPGTYPSQNLATHVRPGDPWSRTYAAVTYTVPDGWANATDWIGSFSLAPSSDYALYPVEGPPPGGTHEIALYPWPAASDQNAQCSATNRTDVPRTVDGMIEFITGLRAVASSGPQPITIDGRDGRWVDVQIARGWTGTCPGEPVPVVPLFKRAGPPVSWNLELRDKARMRLIVLDVGQGDIVLIAVVSDEPDRFDDLAAQSMPIIESFHFK